ncbi:Imm32 family immunity protein [Paenibacillus sp. Leaf72]|uniref:Imm32 family immunity protein n=1 Tax=Paenibacillus sp. Leaf72 TaxID=1736234 RepID=UPI0006F40D15|nr:hypothetical protein [Paenibacillus sp. Leaf72]KQO15410.1 hypothetical protein ASF12_28510 [Paenibacillus sp. Leaf72]
MNIEINIPNYRKEEGIKFVWDDNFTIESSIEGSIITIKANEAGLRSLARQLLTLAQPEVPSGNHMHYDDLNSLEDGSCELIIEKI